MRKLLVYGITAEFVNLFKQCRCMKGSNGFKYFIQINHDATPLNSVHNIKDSFVLRLNYNTDFFTDLF